MIIKIELNLTQNQLYILKEFVLFQYHHLNEEKLKYIDIRDSCASQEYKQKYKFKIKELEKPIADFGILLNQLKTGVDKIIELSEEYNLYDD